MKILGVELHRSSTLEKLREAYADVERALEDIGWIGLNQPTSLATEFSKESFVSIVKRSRMAYIKSPLVAQAVHLTTSYTFGNGIAQPRAENEEVQTYVNEFWKDPDNILSFTGEDAQQKLSNKLQYDGELFFALQVDKDGSVYVRLLDSLTVADVITDALDGMRPLFYKRMLGTTTQYIPDYQNGIAFLKNENPEEWKALLLKLRIKENEVLDDTFIYHVKVNNDILDKRGVPEVWRGIDWINANSKIAGDMATFINTQAQYAWKKKVRGSKAQIDAMKASLNQNTNLSNPGKQAGSTIIENDLVENAPINLSASAGTLFETGIRRTLLMFSASMGIMEHYFGDPSTGNLATATAMELPMLKKFQAKQKMWEMVYLNVLNFMLDMKLYALNTNAFDFYPTKNRMLVNPTRDYTDREIDIDFPPIIEKDIKMMAEALASAKNGQLIPIETAQRVFLAAIGVNNVDEELEKEFQQPAPAFSPFIPNVPPDAPTKESVAPSEDFQTRRNMAVRLADKNKTVLRRMNGYLREIGAVYKVMYEKLLDGAHTWKEGDKTAGSVNDWEKIVNRFGKDMVKLGERYLPIAVKIGEAYVKSHGSLKESDRKLMEKKADDFINEQVEWNRRYVEESLVPAIKAKMVETMARRFDDDDRFIEELENGITGFEKRVGSYAGAFWTVEERAVKFVGDTDQLVNFVGVEDQDNCDECAQAILGNPYRLADAPVPGEQTCLTHCRHALQLASDEPLEEADIQILRDAEKEAKRGMSITDKKKYRKKKG